MLRFSVPWITRHTPHASLIVLFLGAILQVACDKQITRRPITPPTPGAAAPAPNSADDVPSVAARIALIEGTASMQPAGVEDWVPAELNRTLTTGDSLWTANNGRAELGAGSTAMRLDANTDLRLMELSDDLTQVSVTSGTLNIRLRRLSEAEAFEVDTPDAVITLLRPGDYRVEVDPNSSLSHVTVRSGQVQVNDGRESFSVRENEQATIGYTASAGYRIAAAPPPDSFDAFCRNRDEQQERSASAQYVSPEVTGYYDLDRYGSWRVDVTWGPAWCPVSIPVGWAPYRYGHWIWVEPWGWVWVDDAPWGFAPFHYGRWVYGPNWCWIPGPRIPRPIYSPALVVFVGGGRPGFQYHVWIGMGTGVGWFPLGPGEVFFPPYHYSRNYLVNINFTNTVIRDTHLYDLGAARQRYSHQQMPGAITVVPRDPFMRGQPVPRNIVNMQERDLRELRVHGTAPPFAPTRESIGPAAAGAPRPPANANRTVLSQHAPPRVVPFEQRQPQLERSPGRPMENRAADALRRAAPTPNVRQLPERPAQPFPTQQRPAPQIQVPPAPRSQVQPPRIDRRREPAQMPQPGARPPQRMDRTEQQRNDQRNQQIQRERQREAAPHTGRGDRKR